MKKPHQTLQSPIAGSLTVPEFCRQYGFKRHSVWRALRADAGLAPLVLDLVATGGRRYAITEPEAVAAAVRARLARPLFGGVGKRWPPRPGMTPDAGGDDGAS